GGGGGGGGGGRGPPPPAPGPRRPPRVRRAAERQSSAAGSRGKGRCSSISLPSRGRSAAAICSASLLPQSGAYFPSPFDSARSTLWARTLNALKSSWKKLRRNE